MYTLLNSLNFDFFIEKREKENRNYIITTNITISTTTINNNIKVNDLLEMLNLN